VLKAVVRIGHNDIGVGPVFVIAEAGVNHNGSPARALEMIDVAADAGADAVKFQTFNSERLLTAAAPKAAYQRTETGSGSQLDMLKELELSEQDHERLMQRCRERGIMFLSTPFEEESADFLHSLGVEAFKVPSGELTNWPFLVHLARKAKPMIVSTGMADMTEVSLAVEKIEGAANSDVVLLHCVSQYPAQPKEANLRAMGTMRDAFGCPVGFSDHTVGAAVAVAAAALGAAVIEKHFTLDRALPGPDHRASLEPGELKGMISDIRVATAALGDGIKKPQPSEIDTALVARKSIVAIRSIKAGEEIKPDHIAAKRPGTGIAPSARDKVIGRRAARAVPADTVLQWSDLA
jgi:N,N'-diacetyllegionaminate synthase